MCSHKHFMLCLIGCAAFSVARASGQGSVEGRVIDSASDKPVPEARVMIALRGVAEAASVRADSRGEFRFPALAPGEYQLHAEAEGYLRIEYDLILKPRQPLVLSIELTPRRVGARRRKSAPLSLTSTRAKPAARAC